MKKISLMSDDYAQIIAFAAEHGHKTTETDPGKILDSACDYLETKHPELITDLNVARYAKNLVKHPPRKKLIPAIILTVLLGTTAWAQYYPPMTPIIPPQIPPLPQLPYQQQPNPYGYGYGGSSQYPLPPLPQAPKLPPAPQLPQGPVTCWQAGNRLFCQ